MTPGNVHRFDVIVPVAAIFLLCSGLALGQTKATNSAGLPAYTGPQPFDMVHYDLRLRFAMTTADMGGTVTMTLIPRQTLTSLTLNAAQLQIDSVRVNGESASSPGVVAGEDWTLQLPSPASAGETLAVALTYHRPTELSRQSDRQGYYYFVPDTAGLRTLPDTIGYTMSEPSDARFWLPCYDEPWDKATAEIRATVPAGFVAASNGVLEDTVANPDGTVTWHWREDHQIATYLLAVTISKWSVSTYPLTLSTGKVIPVQYFVWRSDSAACAAYLPTVAQMITNLGVLFGPYPFDKYGMTGVAPFLFGGMEHQTITTLLRGAETNEGVVVHELGHQWWGDNVTCATWADIWLNEGFASYVEALWRESLGGHAELVRYMKSTHEHFGYSSWAGAIYDPEGQGLYLFSNSVYSKAAWVLHTLRGVLGDSVFFDALRAYRAKFQGGQATTDEFREVVDSVSHQDLRWFFDEWIYGKGYPQYAFHWDYTAGVLTMKVYQQQAVSWPTYRMPIRVKALHGSDGSAGATFTIQDSARVQTFTEPLDFPPDSMVFDPDSWILKQMVAVPTGLAVNARTGPESVLLEQNYPNPFNPTTTFRFTVPGNASAETSLEVFDMTGRRVGILVHGLQRSGEHTVVWDAAHLASGVYVARLRTVVRGVTFERARLAVLVK
jgi:aminopeptidase N